MAERLAEREKLDLGETTGQTEREDSFWNRSVVPLKSTVQPQWLEMACNAKRKPNYGMRGLNGIKEERILNKIELVGPVVDSYVKHMGIQGQRKVKEHWANVANNAFYSVVHFLSYLRFSGWVWR